MTKDFVDMIKEAYQPFPPSNPTKQEIFMSDYFPVIIFLLALFAFAFGAGVLAGYFIFR